MFENIFGCTELQ